MILFALVLTSSLATILHREILGGNAKCMDGTAAVVYVDRDTDVQSADGFYIFLQGGGECRSVQACINRCKSAEHPEYCTAMTELTLEKTGNIWGETNSNPFRNFVKVYVPYCSSDIHQGNNGPNEATGGYIFDGKNVLDQIITHLNTNYKINTAKRVIMNGSSSGGKGTAGNCNSIGDRLLALNSNIDYKCIADAAGWIPLPVYNSVDCDNDKEQLKSTALWNRSMNEGCSDAATEQGQNNITSCAFETQFANFVHYPIMFTGSLQDEIFLQWHMCYNPWSTTPSNLLAWWINRLYEVTVEYSIMRPEIGLWITSCPGHGQIYGGGAGGFNPNVVRGVTIVEAMEMWALDGEIVHAIDSVTYSNPFCPDGLCYAISRRSHCGSVDITEAQCASIGCAWCPQENDHPCITVVLDN